jgi:NADH dehydrogenase
VVVCGGGFTGIEMALELPGRLREIWALMLRPELS